jgi:hypothetical protein
MRKVMTALWQSRPLLARDPARFGGKSRPNMNFSGKSAFRT